MVDARGWKRRSPAVRSGAGEKRVARRVATHLRPMPETPLILLRRCADPKCGVKFRPRRPWQKYHSPGCRKRQWDRDRARGRHEALACPHCGKP